MILIVCAVRDRQTDSYGNPIFVRANGEAIRSFSDEVNRADAQNMLSSHPEDYDLFRLGTFDTDSGLFDTGRPSQLAVGKDLKLNGSK